MAGAAAAILGGLVSGGSGLIGSLINKKANQETNTNNKEIQDSVNATNIQLQEMANKSNEDIAQMNIDYQNAYNQQIFDREDTAYQRTLADMQAAGLNPLAMNGINGAGGTASAPQNTAQNQAAQIEAAKMESSNWGSGIGDSMNGAINAALDIYAKKQQIEFNNQELEQRRKEAEVDSLHKAALEAKYENDLAERIRHNKAQENLYQRRFEDIKGLLQMIMGNTTPDTNGAKYQGKEYANEEEALEAAMKNFEEIGKTGNWENYDPDDEINKALDKMFGTYTDHVKELSKQAEKAAKASKKAAKANSKKSKSKKEQKALEEAANFANIANSINY